MRLNELVEIYIAERDNCEGYNEHLRRAIRDYSNYIGQHATTELLDYDVINRWLASILSRRSKSSAKCAKKCLVTLWIYAAERGCADWPQTRRLKRIREEYSIPEAYTRDEIRCLIKAAGKMTGMYPWGVMRRDYWPALIRASFDIGFRRGDMLSLPRTIESGSPFTWVEHKTGLPQCRVLSAEGCELLGKLKKNRLAFPWTLRMTSFNKTWRTLVKHSGVGRGQFKWLRRSHGTYAGTLGHRSSDVFQRHYYDSSLEAKPTTPGKL